MSFELEEHGVQETEQPQKEDALLKLQNSIEWNLDPVDVNTVVHYIYDGLRAYRQKHPKWGTINHIKVSPKGVCTSTNPAIDRKVYPKPFWPWQAKDMSILVWPSWPLTEWRYVFWAEGTCGIIREFAAAFAPDKNINAFEMTQKVYEPNNPKPVRQKRN